MLAQTPTLHRHTPTLTATDPRGLTLRSVGYCCIAQGGSAESRVNRTAHDAAGRAIAQWDPRLFRDASAPANLASVYSLSGKVLSTTSVDAGWRVSLLGEADQLEHSWDGRGSQRRMEYDTLLRPQAVFEQALDEEFSCTERYLYGAADLAFAGHNQCGQLIRHDDPAGTQRRGAFGLTGALLEQIQHFLRMLDSPDWPVPLEERNRLLEPGEGATTLSRFNPLGELIEQIDAKGNRQFFSQTVGGQLREAHLQLNAQANRQTLVNAIQYNAHGQTERETAGNDVITTLTYRPEDGRLTQLQAWRSGGDTLQYLIYCYDPVGNVLSIEDKVQRIHYFANQRIDPINRYRYDSLYQLIEATGWEAGGPNKGPQFSAFNDPAPRGNYRQTYAYDRGGNLLKLTHEGPQNQGHRLVAAPFNNRCLPVRDDVEPGEEDFRNGFDANGNVLNLQPGQALSWDLRNQLKEVRPVARDSGLNDSEHYIYCANGMRRRKVRSTQINARTLSAEVRYLPSLEIRTHSSTGEELHVVIAQAGRSSVRVLHWETAPPKDIANDQYRYSLTDHLGSCTLELDSAGEVISQENYHPFGSTAWFAGKGEVEASYKTVRYSGKERDATGLYYYGFRYYIAWWQRWLNPDPARDVDGLNMFRMILGNPLSHHDEDGLQATPMLRLKVSAENEKKYNVLLRLMNVRSWTLLKKLDDDLARGANALLRKHEEERSEIIERYGDDNEELVRKKLEAMKYSAFYYSTLAASSVAYSSYDQHSTEHFYNLPGSLKKRDKFPGVGRLNFKVAGRGAFYEVDDKVLFFGALEKAYAPEKLNPLIKKRIEDYLQANSNILPVRAGVVGLHAEVRAVNNLLNFQDEQHEGARGAFDKLINTFVFTRRLELYSGAVEFPACPNCAGVLSAPVHIMTGAKEGGFRAGWSRVGSGRWVSNES